MVGADSVAFRRAVWRLARTKTPWDKLDLSGTEAHVRKHIAELRMK